VVLAAGCGNMDNTVTSGGGDPNADPGTYSTSMRMPTNPMMSADPAQCPASTSGLTVGPADKDLGLNQFMFITSPPAGHANLAIGRDSQKIVAMDATCTHLGCRLPTPRPESDIIVCNCHQSQFSVTGDLLGGPATKPLTRYPVCKGSDGLLRIDLTKPY
jgi:Rieske Fe-S protein